VRLTTKAARTRRGPATERTLGLFGVASSAPPGSSLGEATAEVSLDAQSPITGYRATVTLTLADDPELLDSLIERLQALRASRRWLPQQADHAAELASEGE